MREKIEELEKLKMKLFSETHEGLRTDIQISDDEYLYHGIRKSNLAEQLEVLEKICKNGILSGKDIPGYYCYSDNCNHGKYVSLLEKGTENELEFETFVKPNISLLVFPFVPAYQTIYVPYDLWEYINSEYEETKNLYSYARGEYQIDKVDVTYIEAIGMPYLHLMMSKNPKVVEICKRKIIEILESLNLDIPIVDTSSYNSLIYQKKK